MGIPYLEISTIGIPALIAVGSAVIAGREARKARLSEHESEKLRFAEERISTHRYDVYEPLVTMIGRALRGGGLPDDFQDIQDRFISWQLVYGSDDAVQAYGRLMQSTYEDAPPEILVRMYAEFFIAVRRDLGDPETSLQNLDVMAPRIKDLFQGRTYYEAITLPLSDLFDKYGWQAPWDRTPDEMNQDWDEIQEINAAAALERSQNQTSEERFTPPVPPSNQSSRQSRQNERRRR